MGAPYDVYLLNDFLKGQLRPYKLYIFLNAFRMDDNRRAALKKELCRDGHTALWIYAPGYIKDSSSVDYMKDLTGFTFVENPHPWPSFMHISNFSHPITRELPQDLFWGTDSQLGPLFHLADSNTTVLGNIVMAQGTCQPGFAVREFPGWRSVYIAVPNIPAQILRSIARYSNVHIYSEEGDVLEASRNLLCVHTISGGERKFSLPEEVEVIYDLFGKTIIGRNTSQFTVTLPASSTALYFTGNESLTDILNK